MPFVASAGSSPDGASVPVPKSMTRATLFLPSRAGEWARVEPQSRWWAGAEWKRFRPPSLFVDSGLAGAGVKLAEPVIKQAGIKLEEDKAYEGAGGGGKLKIVPYTVRQLSLGDIEESNVPGLYDGPFPWENSFGFHLAGMVGHDFLKPYAVTFDFETMRIFLR